MHLVFLNMVYPSFGQRVIALAFNSRGRESERCCQRMDITSPKGITSLKAL